MIETQRAYEMNSKAISDRRPDARVPDATSCERDRACSSASHDRRDAAVALACAWSCSPAVAARAEPDSRSTSRRCRHAPPRRRPPRTARSTSAGYDVGAVRGSAARRVGDILTVVLVERTNASKSVEHVDARRRPPRRSPGPTIGGRPVTVERRRRSSTTDVESDARVRRRGRLRARATGSTATSPSRSSQRLPNGNLLVRGEKWITHQPGRGVHPPRRHRAARSTSSPTTPCRPTKVADARITYGGKGALADANSRRAGWRASSTRRCSRSEEARHDVHLPAVRACCSASRHSRRSAPRAGARRRAHQGPRDGRRRARQPAGRLRPRRRPRRHRRPDEPDAVHDAEHQEHAGAASASRAAERQSRSCKNVAAVTVQATLPPFAKPGQTHRHHRVVDRQRAEPARRQRCS